MQFQFDFRERDGRKSLQSLGVCAVSSNLASLPSWVQSDMVKWKDGDTFTILERKFVDGKSFYEQKTFELKITKITKGSY